jgi:hypothetical protein
MDIGTSTWLTSSDGEDIERKTIEFSSHVAHVFTTLSMKAGLLMHESLQLSRTAEMDDGTQELYVRAIEELDDYLHDADAWSMIDDVVMSRRRETITHLKTDCEYTSETEAKSLHLRKEIVSDLDRERYLRKDLEPAIIWALASPWECRQDAIIDVRDLIEYIEEGSIPHASSDFVRDVIMDNNSDYDVQELHKSIKVARRKNKVSQSHSPSSSSSSSEMWADDTITVGQLRKNGQDIVQSRNKRATALQTAIDNSEREHWRFDEVAELARESFNYENLQAGEKLAKMVDTGGIVFRPNEKITELYEKLSEKQKQKVRDRYVPVGLSSQGNNDYAIEWSQIQNIEDIDDISDVDGVYQSTTTVRALITNIRAAINRADHSLNHMEEQFLNYLMDRHDYVISIDDDFETVE